MIIIMTIIIVVSVQGLHTRRAQALSGRLMLQVWVSGLFLPQSLVADLGRRLFYISFGPDAFTARDYDYDSTLK